MIVKPLYVLHCSFQITKEGHKHVGLAICEDADTPITFIFPSGMPYNGEIWDYKLNHYAPWARLEVVP